MPIAVTAGAALAICAGVFGVKMLSGGGKKVVGETAKKTAETVKETATKANKTIQEQQQEISKILKNLKPGQKFTKDEATQLTQYLTAYNSALSPEQYPGIDICNYKLLINNFIKNINEKFENDSVESIDIEKNNDPLIQDINEINGMFKAIKNLVESQNQQRNTNQNIEKIDIEVEEEKPDPVVPDPETDPGSNKNQKCKNKMGYPFISTNNTLGLSVETLDKFKNIQYITNDKHTRYYLCFDTEVEVSDEDPANKHVDINGVTIDESKQAFQVEFEDGKKTYAYCQELKLDMPYSDIEKLLENPKIKLELLSYLNNNFLQQYLEQQTKKVSGATDQDLRVMLDLTTKVEKILESSEGIAEEIKRGISTANTDLINAIQQQERLNANLKAFDADPNSSNLFNNFASLKTLISTYNLEANHTYYIDIDNVWTELNEDEDEDEVPENAKFVIEVGDDTADFTITKKDAYCDLVYDSKGITVEATPAKKYIDIITAEKSKDLTDPELECEMPDKSKETALENLKGLLRNSAFLEQYRSERGQLICIKDKIFKSCFEKLKSVSNVTDACDILTQNPNIKKALETTTISTTCKSQDALTKAINNKNTPYLNDILVINTAATLPLFSGDTKDKYIIKIDGNTTVYTSNGEPQKKYTVTCSKDQNTVTINDDENEYTYDVSKDDCNLPKNVPEDNKDLFEYFVYMALPDDDKKKAFAHCLLKQIELTKMVENVNSVADKESRDAAKKSRDALQKKVLRLIVAATDSDNVQNAVRQLLQKTTGIVLFIDSQYNFIVEDSRTYPKKNRPLIKIHINSSNKKLTFTRIT